MSHLRIFWPIVCLLQFVLLLIIYTFLGLAPAPEHFIPTFNDKLMHTSGYIVAAGSISFAVPCLPYWQRAFWLIGYSIAIEVVQHFCPPRTFDLFDLAANSLGVTLGLVGVFLLSRYLAWFDRLLNRRFLETAAN